MNELINKAYFYIYSIVLGLHIFIYYKFFVIYAFKTDHFNCIYNSIHLQFNFISFSNLSSTTQCRCDCTFKTSKIF